MDDEGRLFYVAITRARELVVISWFTNYKDRVAPKSELLILYVRKAMKNAKEYGSLVPMVSQKSESDELLDVSFSSLTTFMECAYRYWLRHVCGFRSPRVPELGFGKILHHVIAELARGSMDREEPDSTKADQVLDGSFYLPYAGPIPAELLRKTARKRIHHYVQNYGSELLRTYQPEFMFEVPFGNARVRGRIDLILRSDGNKDKRVDLIDFKTAENRPPSWFHQNQLRLYASAADKMGFEPDSLAIHDLDTEKGGRYEVAYDLKEKERFEEELGEWVGQIKKGIFNPTEDASKCKGCDFQAFCPHGPGRR